MEMRGVVWAKKPGKKALLTSSWYMGHDLKSARLRTVLMVGLTTALNESSQSIPTVLGIMYMNDRITIINKTNLY